ncbi:2-amino-4-hydroxy-6-hydroxymethyldihydropteridine diphosphokinase [Brachybacterium sp. EF45031]|nr:2-amino-4-hydroxy-6-hydroxymethyldihydropteridine diphosphokinase [Brachybacterium sillae]
MPEVGAPAPHRDVIRLRGVRAHGHHGVLEHERRDGQEFLADVALHLALAPAARGDVLDRTVNYAEVAQILVEEITGPPVDLIETVAERAAARILAEHPLVRRLDLVLHKPSAPIPHPFTDVAVEITRTAPPVEAVLALGSNLQDRRALLERALDLLDGAAEVQRVWTGPILETDPVGGVEQGGFLNTTVGVRTTLGPWELLGLAHALERDAHRERQVRWGPRTLDVDVITWGDLMLDDPDLTLPHPRAHERAFVLAPWHAVRPDDTLVGHDGPRPIADLLAAAPDRHGLHAARQGDTD